MIKCRRKTSALRCALAWGVLYHIRARAIFVANLVCSGDPGGGAPQWILGPAARQVGLPVDQCARAWAEVGREHRHLTDLDTPGGKDW